MSRSPTKRRWGCSLLAAGLASAGLATAAWGDFVGGDLSNEVAGITQSITVTRGGLPAPGEETLNEDTALYWLIANDNDGLTGCNADAANPVTIKVTAPAGIKFLVNGSYVATTDVVRTNCGSGTVVPADASAVPYAISASAPLGTNRLTATATGGRTYVQSNGQAANGTFTTSNLTINVRPRDPGSVDASANGRRVNLTWGASADDASLTGYEVYRRAAGGDWVFTGLAVGTGYADVDLNESTAYCYRVRASYYETQSNGSTKGFQSNYSSEKCVTTGVGNGNTAPGAPGAPELSDGENPNKSGRFSLGWAAATDAEGDSLTYTLEHRDSDDANWLPIASGIGRTFTFNPASSEAEGTWTYRVRADDGTEHGAYSAVSAPIKVDKTDPFAPTVSVPEADYPFGHWYKDKTVVTFTSAGDRKLLDGSDGSGVASVTDPVTVTGNLGQVVTGKTTDTAGNSSIDASTNVNIDSKPPVVTLVGCPTSPLKRGASGAGVTVQASDDESGIALVRSGTSEVTAGRALPLDTSTAGTKTVQAAAVDNVWSSPEDDDKHSATATCTYTVANDAPSAPGTPSMTKGENPSNTGVFSLGWTAATDPEGDAVTYTVEHRDADDADWSPAGSELGFPKFDFTEAAPEGEGTWSYRTRSNDGERDGTPSGTYTIKVDKTAPLAPTTEVRAADYSPGGGAPGWYRDSVKVTFKSAGDPKLADGSAGTGVTKVTDPVELTGNGERTAEGTARDDAGNESEKTSLTLRVDSAAPKLLVTGCPSGSVGVWSKAPVLNVSATDAESGVASVKSGSTTINASGAQIPLDTTTWGSRTVSIVALDNVGHSTTVSCTYQVRFSFQNLLSFLQALFNKWYAAKAGNEVPIRFSVGGNAGLSIFASGYPKMTTVSCDSPAPDTDGTAATASSPLSYDSGSKSYTWTWKTSSSMANQCRQLVIKLVDGSYQRFNYKLSK